MPSEYCFGPLCFVPLTDPSPGIFGLPRFIPGLALMALAWTTADARYRFRVASAALRVRTILSAYSRSSDLSRASQASGTLSIGSFPAAAY